jgi:hypothetical protein
MSVTVLHHGRCFDGAASAAIFTAFYRTTVNAKATFVYRPKLHRRGDPFDDADFQGPITACLDFRYTKRQGLDWYFDHHASAFQLEGEKAHFESRRGPRHFHDPAAPCCATYMAKVLGEQYGFDTSAFGEMLTWAEMIDTANFPSPELPVAMEAPAIRLAAFIQSAERQEDIDRFIEDLLVRPFEELARVPYIDAVVRTRKESHAHDCERLAQIARVERRVLEYDLLDEAPRVLSHFIPYAQHPEVDYVVGIYAHGDGDLRLTLGYNPWKDPRHRAHNLAEICERYGGGGHPFVAGCSFPLGDESACRRAQQEILEFLRNSS